jgi:hypothetical protein
MPMATLRIESIAMLELLEPLASLVHAIPRYTVTDESPFNGVVTRTKQLHGDLVAIMIEAHIDVVI